MYFDTRNNAIIEAEYLHYNGLPGDAAGLCALGVLPLLDDRPEYDADLYTLIQDGQPLPSGGEYVQHWTASPKPLDEARAAKKARATAMRWQVETGGVDEPGFGRILTTLEDQNRIATALMGINAASDAGQPIEAVDFKTPAGWTHITAQELASIAAIVAAHVQACFARECALHSAIDAASSVDELVAIDVGAGWPATAAGEMPT